MRIGKPVARRLGCRRDRDAQLARPFDHCGVQPVDLADILADRAVDSAAARPGAGSTTHDCVTSEA